ncbi:MAG TPA: hypothetical protein VLH60_05700, partial [Sedimentisphaerales bacterium]|nr:hypothetical protein [Sedimentisphaerales bacterium]
MAETGSRQFDISKVVFLAILLLAIFAAWEFSTGRTALKMEPVEAISGELAISLPSGDNWRDDGGGQWIYHQQSFVQRRVYGEQACTVEVRYYLSPITGDAASYLPAAGGGRNLERIGQGELSSGGINWAWAAYGSGRGQAQLYYAVARLGDYRMVTVSVHGRGGTWLLAEMVFEAIINSAKYHDTGLLTEGAGLVASVQEEGVEAIRNAFSADVFVINDEVGAAVGFYISRIPMVSETGETVVDGMLYQTNPRALLSRTRFVTFDIVNFEWHTWHPGHPGSGAIVEAQDGVLSEVRGGLRRRGQAVSRAAIADAVTELVGWQLVSRGIPEAVVDVISHDRTVTPMQVRP